jgi:hypothetical protein
LFKRRVGLFVDYGVLLNPPDFVFAGLHFEEAPPGFENLERLSIHDLGYAIGNGGYAIVEIHLRRRHIDGLVLHFAKPVTSRAEKNGTKQQARQQTWEQARSRRGSRAPCAALE